MKIIIKVPEEHMGLVLKSVLSWEQRYRGQNESLDIPIDKRHSLIYQNGQLGYIGTRNVFHNSGVGRTFLAASGLYKRDYRTIPEDFECRSFTIVDYQSDVKDLLWYETPSSHSLTLSYSEQDRLLQNIDLTEVEPRLCHKGRLRFYIKGEPLPAHIGSLLTLRIKNGEYRLKLDLS